MSRPLRIQFSGATYHITVRGHRKKDIFLSDYDREDFLAILAKTIETHNWLCYAYCLMGNHYHLLIETPEANLSLGMRDLNGGYTQSFNKKYGLTGTAFQGRFKSFLIEKEPYLLNVARYIDLNPVRAKMVREPEDWAWSSYRASIGLVPTPVWLSTGFILGHFPLNPQKSYAEFVQNGRDLDSPFSEIREGSVLGSQQFLDAIYEESPKDVDRAAISKPNRLIGRPTLEVIFHSLGSKQERNLAIRIAKFNCGYSYEEISKHLHLSLGHVSRLARKIQETRPDPNL